MSNQEVSTEKLAALQTFVQTYYIPSFVKTCADAGLNFENETDLAHALQLNGKFAALVSSGVSIDSLVDTIVSGLNVKHAHEGGINISLGTMNYALDFGLNQAGIPLDPMNKAAAADAVVYADDAELLAFIDVVG